MDVGPDWRRRGVLAVGSVLAALVTACQPPAETGHAGTNVIKEPEPANASSIAQVQPVEIDTAAIEAAVQKCVTDVRSSVPRVVRYEQEKEFWTRFDAYYNPLNGKVSTNATVRGSIPAAFQFQKCMVQHGFYPKE